jgi:hypothetical protein
VMIVRMKSTDGLFRSVFRPSMIQKGITRRCGAGSRCASAQREGDLR